MTDRSIEHLRARVDALMTSVEGAVARRRETDPNPDDRFRGLYVSDSTVDELVNGSRPPLWEASAKQLPDAIEITADEWEAAGDQIRLLRMARAFGLDELDVSLFLIVLAPDLDPRFERLYGYLHDDVTRRRASIGLALELCGIDPAGTDGRAHLSPAATLLAGGLLVVEEEDRPLLSRMLRVPDRVSAHLLGDDAFEPALAAALLEVPTEPYIAWPVFERAMQLAISPIYVREMPGTSAAAAAAGAIIQSGRQPLVIDLSRIAAAPDLADLTASAIREARLRDWVLVSAPVEVLVERAPHVIDALADSAAVSVLAGSRLWDPAWSRAVPLSLEAPQPSSQQRSQQWAAALDGHGSDEAVLHATQVFRLTPVQIARAATAGRVSAMARDRNVQPDDIQAGARAQNAAGLDRLSLHTVPKAVWNDLVLPVAVVAHLRELTARARGRERVYDEWGVGGNAVRGRGITALFAGDSGTGKTLASEVIASELGLDLYVIDLSTVIDKYIGETEKNLDRIFAEADRVNGVLLFDEADAIFGKRSEVRDARDRYANIEIAYLLQRMERFDGLAILTTNLRANLDDAFTRRIDVIVDFPMPEEDDRRALWRMHLPRAVPQATDIDLDFLARRFHLTGGNIRNICVTAAFLAADGDRAVSMADLIRATEREYRKLGRLTVEDEFGRYFALTSYESRPV